MILGLMIVLLMMVLAGSQSDHPSLWGDSFCGFLSVLQQSRLLLSP